MITFPNAKINLGLNIVEKRADGYHNLETVFYPTPWNDALEIVANSQNPDIKCSLYLSGKHIPDENENLIIRAYNILDKDFNLSPVDVYLYKSIPLGAGLGGGSSNAAFMLKLLNNKFNLSLSTETLETYAAKLGADCAFFIKNEPVYAEGIGNIFTPISVGLKNYQIVIIKPDLFVSTKDAFAKIAPHKPVESIKEIIGLPIKDWKEYLRNDFEKSVFEKYPEIGNIKQTLYDKGAIYASMSGSGSSVYGIFEPDFKIPEMKKEGIEYFQAIL
jgi:4-diphosphocytidyl-2C-methyl-D-erythritol kinase